MQTSIYHLGGFPQVGYWCGLLVKIVKLMHYDLKNFLCRLIELFLDLFTLLLHLPLIYINTSSYSYINITISYGVVSLQLPVEYPQLPANLID